MTKDKVMECFFLSGVVGIAIVLFCILIICGVRGGPMKEDEILPEDQEPYILLEFDIVTNGESLLFIFSEGGEEVGRYDPMTNDYKFHGTPELWKNWVGVVIWQQVLTEEETP
jgi:hypothetical protein